MALYHYTSLDALTSIVQHRQLWLTRSEFLNDPLDCKLLLKLFQRYVEEQGQEVFDTWLSSKKSSSTYKERNQKALTDFYRDTSPVDYLAFLQSRIHLYVLSLTDSEDAISMWNYYGSGGVAIAADQGDQGEGKLSKALRESLNGLKDDTPEADDKQKPAESRYLVCSPVLYISENDEIKEIKLTSASVRHVKSGKPVEYKHKKLDQAFRSFFEGYLNSIRAVIIASNKAGASIKFKNLLDDKAAFYQKVYEDQVQDRSEENNGQNADRDFSFIKKRLLYMLALSALLKSETYAHEKEYRVVIFENSLEPSPALPVKYRPHELNGQKYLRPYLELDVALDFIQGVTLSPLARNLPIDSDIYCQIMEDFLHSQLSPQVYAQWSARRIRW